MASASMEELLQGLLMEKPLQGLAMEEPLQGLAMASLCCDLTTDPRKLLSKRERKFRKVRNVTFEKLGKVRNVTFGRAGKLNKVTCWDIKKLPGPDSESWKKVKKSCRKVKTSKKSYFRKVRKS